MTPQTQADRRPRLRRLTLVLAWVVLALPAAGCATLWDELWSRERDLDGYFHPRNPLLVIQESTDGERRAKALASLREPAQNGGDAKEQEAYLDILTKAAQTDRDPLCRLGAIQALGYFKDPRAADTLEKVFGQTKLPFTQEFNATIKNTALRALEKSGNEDTRKFFIVVALGPGPAQDVSSADRRQTQDEKLIAIRALGKFRQPDSVETLVSILETEKDSALRDRAHQSLQSATGRSLPPDAQAWRTALATPGPAEPPSLIQRAAAWFNK